MDTHGTVGTGSPTPEKLSERPFTVRLAMLAVGLLVLVGAVTAVLGVVFSDDLVTVWAGGVGLTADDTRVPPSFSPVVVVLDVVLTGLVLVLSSLMWVANNWARHCLVALGVLLAVAIVAGLRAGPPVVFVFCSVVVLVLDALLVVNLVHPQTNAFLRPEPRRVLRARDRV